MIGFGKDRSDVVPKPDRTLYGLNQTIVDLRRELGDHWAVCYQLGLSTLTKIRRARVRPPVTPATRERLRIAAKARWADPVIELRSAIGSPATREKVSKAKKALWADPGGRKKMQEALGSGSSRAKNREATGPIRRREKR